MEKTISTARVEQKANIFKILSVLYKQPNEDFDYYLTQLIINIKELYPHLLTQIKELENEFNGHVSDLTSLKVEHAKLFIGPFDLLAPPYSSIYLNQGRAIYGESTLEALNLYKESGMDMSADFKDLPDHISVELEFIYFLYFSYHENAELKYLQQIEKFIEIHLLKWIKPFTEKIAERATENFYKILAEVSLEVVRQEAIEIRVKISN